MKKSFQHTIDFLFPIALFFVFSASALLALLMAANLYNNIVLSSNRTFEQGTALSYITEKIRQNDEGGSGHIYLSEFDGYDCLTISQSYGEQIYTTYIYEAEGILKELFLQEGVNASSKAGASIMEVGDLTMDQISDGLFRFTCASSDGSSDSVIVSVRSDTP